MAVRVATGRNVFEEAVYRLAEVYRQGHRVVVSFSAGKDSGVCLELAILAARDAGKLPVDVVMRDEEVMYPGTYEYAERVAARPEVSFHWLYACQPVLNVYNRAMPYFWVFDPLLSPDRWVRTPPAIAYQIPEQHIGAMVIPTRFPVPEGKELYDVVGLRVSESVARLYGLYSAKGHIKKPNAFGVRGIRPIYDWQDGDIWKAIRDNRWDYNEAYDVMHRMGIPRSQLRIAPPTMSASGSKSLAIAAKAWPTWFERVAGRLEGVRAGANFGKRAVSPVRRYSETWEECFERSCIREAPEWIRERSEVIRRKVVQYHARHSSGPLPDIAPCTQCQGRLGSWKNITEICYSGDPFCLKVSKMLPYIEPDFFRPGSGKWSGAPTF